METLEEWNQWVKDYLFDTDNKEKTNRDILVQQIIDAYETENESIEIMDYDGLYDLEEEEIIRIVEREYNYMMARIAIVKRKNKNETIL